MRYLVSSSADFFFKSSLFFLVPLPCQTHTCKCFTESVPNLSSSQWKHTDSIWVMRRWMFKHPSPDASALNNWSLPSPPARAHLCWHGAELQSLQLCWQGEFVTFLKHSLKSSGYNDPEYCFVLHFIEMNWV